MSNFIEHNNRIAFHPGYYIQENIEHLGITAEEFAKRLGTSAKTLNLLVQGEQDITPDMAEKLSRLFGTSAQMWLNLQQQYDETRREMLSALDASGKRFPA